MGIETAALILAGVSAASEVGKMHEEMQVASERERALDLQAKEMALKTQQKTLANYDVMEKVLDAQIAHMTTTGTSFSSPSFNAIQRNTFNTGAKEQRNIDIEGDIEQSNIKTEKENVKSQLYASLFGDTVEAASAAFSLYSKAPKAPKMLKEA